MSALIWNDITIIRFGKKNIKRSVGPVTFFEVILFY